MNENDRVKVITDCQFMHMKGTVTQVITDGPTRGHVLVQLDNLPGGDTRYFKPRELVTNVTLTTN